MIEHPLISGLDHLNQDELISKITDLNQKLSIAMRTGNGHLCNQLRMALESYNSKYQEKLKASYGNVQSFSDKINIQ